MRSTGNGVLRKTGITRISEVRRKDLIDAAITCIADLGYGEVTVQKIGERAGVSKGLIGHYFAGKDALLIEAVRQVAEELGTATRTAARSAGIDPLARLHAVVHASFSPPGFTLEKVAVWAALASNARWSEELSTMYHTLWRNYRLGIGDLVARAAKNMDKTVDSEIIALTFSQLIEGLWIAWLADPKAVTQTAAENACHHYLEAVLGTSR